MEALDNNMYRKIKFSDLTADTNEVLVGYKGEGSDKVGIIYADYLPVIGGDEFEFLMEGRIECKNFLKEYKINHAKCPKCGAESHSTTYVGYILHMDKKDEYKDLNKCVFSECGNVHTTHDRVKLK